VQVRLPLTSTNTAENIKCGPSLAYSEGTIRRGEQKPNLSLQPTKTAESQNDNPVQTQSNKNIVYHFMVS